MIDYGYFQVLMANNRREGNVRDPKETERMLRLFIVIPKTMTQSDLENQFEVQHGWHNL